MTWLLASILAAVTSAFIALVFLNRSDNRETLAARELVADKDKQIALLVGELDVTRHLLAKERQLRESAEEQRNQSFQDGVNHAVEKVKAANIADANKILAGILAAPLGMPQAVPEGRTTAPGPDALIDPSADM